MARGDLADGLAAELGQRVRPAPRFEVGDAEPGNPEPSNPA
jgi:hypothetical protein